jgi:hypothetical protein
MLRRVALVRTDVTEELSASFIRVTRIGELGTTLAVISNGHTLRRNTKLRRLLVTASVVPSLPIHVTLMKEALSSSETLVLTKAYQRVICGAGVEPSPLLLRPLIGLLYKPWITDGDNCGEISGMNERQGQSKYSEKTLSQYLSVHHRYHVTWHGSNPDRRGGKTAGG